MCSYTAFSHDFLNRSFSFSSEFLFYLRTDDLGVVCTMFVLSDCKCITVYFEVILAVDVVCFWPPSKQLEIDTKLVVLAGSGSAIFS